MLIRGSIIEVIAYDLNSLTEGSRYTISKYALDEIGVDDRGRSALERIKDNVLGSDHSEVWKITEDSKGNVTFERLNP